VRFWRIAVGPNTGLNGEGARLYGGRWNSEGTALVYAATRLSLAIIEVLVHVPPRLWPDQAEAFAITLPDNATIESFDADRHALRQPEDFRAFGDAWVSRRNAQAVLVPSVIVPTKIGDIVTEETNALLNPAFASDWTIARAPFRLDERLRRSD
jgi:RES domain-containing protein